MCGHYSSNRTADALVAHIAEALGGSVESLFGVDAQASTLSLTNEMLTLWLALESHKSRAVILDIVRAAVAAQAD